MKVPKVWRVLAAAIVFRGAASWTCRARFSTLVSWAGLRNKALAVLLKPVRQSDR